MCECECAVCMVCVVTLPTSKAENEKRRKNRYIINAIACLSDADQKPAIEETFGDSKLTEKKIISSIKAKRDTKQIDITPKN